MFRQYRTELSLLIAVIAVLGLTILFDGTRAYQIHTHQNVTELLLQTSLLGIVAIGVAVVIMSGGIDLSAGSVIAFRVLHAMSHLLINLVAIIPAFLLFPATPPVWIGLGILTIALVAIVWFLIGRHRDGLLVDLVALIARLPLIGKLVRPLLPSAARLEEVDRHFTDTYRQRPAAFRQAMAAEMVSRLLTMAEFAFILWAQGGGFRPFAALTIGAFSSLIVNSMAFVPYELGTREAGLYGLFHVMGLDPAMGTQAAVLTRVRELIWMTIGLTFLGLIKPPRSSSTGT